MQTQAPPFVQQQQATVDPAPSNTGPVANSPVKEPMWMRILLLILEVIAIVLIVFYLLRLFILNPYTVTGSSMYPTLVDGQQVYINTLSYLFKEPQRGDIVVLVPPVDVGKKYVKRIIGIPGDKVQITGDGQVLIYNHIHEGGIALREPYLESSYITKGYVIDTLREDEYFVMGDNRTASSDSRGQTSNLEDGVGTDWTVPKDNIVGKVLVRTSPLSEFEFFTTPKYNF